MVIERRFVSFHHRYIYPVFYKQKRGMWVICMKHWIKRTQYLMQKE